MRSNNHPKDWERLFIIQNPFRVPVGHTSTSTRTMTHSIVFYATNYGSGRDPFRECAATEGHFFRQRAWRAAISPDSPSTVTRRYKADGSGIKVAPDDSASVWMNMEYSVLASSVEVLPVNVGFCMKAAEALGPIDIGLSKNTGISPLSNVNEKMVSEDANRPALSVNKDWSIASMAEISRVVSTVTMKVPTNEAGFPKAEEDAEASSPTMFTA